MNAKFNDVNLLNEDRAYLICIARKKIKYKTVLFIGLFS